MSLKIEMEGLRRHFSGVAALARADYPLLWKRVVNAPMVSDDRAAVYHLTNPLAGFQNRNLLEVASEFGEDVALQEIDRLEAGGFA